MSMYHWLDWGPFPYPGTHNASSFAKPVPLPVMTAPIQSAEGKEEVPSARTKRSLKSLYEETIDLIPYSDILTWWLEQITTNPEMTVLLEKLGVQISCP